MLMKCNTWLTDTWLFEVGGNMSVLSFEVRHNTLFRVHHHHNHQQGCSHSVCLDTVIKACRPLCMHACMCGWVGVYQDECLCCMLCNKQMFEPLWGLYNRFSGALKSSLCAPVPSMQRPNMATCRWTTMGTTSGTEREKRDIKYCSNFACCHC